MLAWVDGRDTVEIARVEVALLCQGLCVCRRGAVVSCELRTDGEQAVCRGRLKGQAQADGAVWRSPPQAVLERSYT
jgi:hypothetical protein